MITRTDLEQAIAECQGERSPNANTCVKLAAFYTIRRELFGTPEPSAYSYAASAGPVDTHTFYTSDTEFSAELQRLDPSDVWPVIDELMTTLQTVLPRLYDAVMRRLRAIP